MDDIDQLCATPQLKWPHRVILMPSNKCFHDILCSHFVREPKGTKPSCLAQCIPTPPKQRGLGL